MVQEMNRYVCEHHQAGNEAQTADHRSTLRGYRRYVRTRWFNGITRWANSPHCWSLRSTEHDGAFERPRLSDSPWRS
jgi:hypothetical protein